jgi:Txe/YoeB family toxin of Txe-Axe toxin-antitoxin module
MEPRQPGLSGGFEHKPSRDGQQNEFAGSTQLERVSNSPEQGFERRVDAPSGAEAEARPPALPTLPSPLPSMQSDATQPTSVADDTAAAMTAADQDLIEKEWVDKAKKIINETRDDPYRREQEVSKLQIEYIRKRYGREIGEAGAQ